MLTIFDNYVYAFNRFVMMTGQSWLALIYLGAAMLLNAKAP